MAFKKYYYPLYLFTFLTILSLLFSCSKSKKEMLTKKWSMEAMKVGEQNLSKDMVSDYYLKFNKKGKYILKEMQGKEKGKWSLNDKKTKIIIKKGNNNKATYTIKSLSENKLVISTVSETTPITKTYKAADDQ